MPPRARKTKSTTVDVGGVAFSAEDVRTAIDILTSAGGVMVKQPLARAGNPLAAVDYHEVAAGQRKLDGDPRAHTKIAFIRALARSLSGELV
jgi:hypothetical protein